MTRDVWLIAPWTVHDHIQQQKTPHTQNN